MGWTVVCDCVISISYSLTSLFKYPQPNCENQQCGILTSVDTDGPLQTAINLRNFKLCSVSSLILIKY